MNLYKLQETKTKANAARWRRCDSHPTAKAVDFPVAVSSVSSYISESIEKNLDIEYSSAFLSTLGSLADVEINRPEHPSISDDA